MNKKLALTLLALSLMAPAVYAQTDAPSAPQATLSPVDAAAVQALKDMGSFLQTLQRFQVTNELTGERVLMDGQKLQHSATAKLDVQRPNKIRVRMLSARGKREIFYNGEQVTLYTPAQKYFSTVDFTENLGGLITKLEDRYAVDMPLADLFLWGTPDAPVDNIDSAMNAGQDFINDDLCNHYAFRQGALDWQIWISAGSKPLPRKLVITNRGDEARPQSVSMINWNLKPTFKNSVFTFTPPKGATQVELHALGNK